VTNDGDGIIVQMHPQEKVYIPEMIFGHLLTSTNYKDDGDMKEMITGGKNGYGAKLTNIYSRKFTVCTNDIASGKKYTQTWTDNMSKTGKPVITKGTAKGEVSIEWIPDMSRFPGGLSDDMYAVLHTRVIELAAVVGAKVTFNGSVVTANTFEKFMKLFLREGMAGHVYERAGERWEIGAVLASQLYQGTSSETLEERHISFVNGINTRKGGKHVDLIVRDVLTDFCEIAKKKRLDLKPGQIRDSVVFFVNATIVNPSFDSQTKENLTTPVAKFGSKPVLTPKFVENLGKLGLFDEAQGILEAKAVKDAKKTDGKKRTTLHGIPKLTDATFAGTAKSPECTLILTEGDSAASSAIAGLTVVGRERYGVFPLKGKPLNVKDISVKKFNENEELTAIKRILGLEHGKVYNDLKSLRYGRILIMTDQDHDGSHIKGLLMNLFDTEWPSLLKIGFVCTLLTPILKAFKGSKTESFYSQAAYEAWRPTAGSGWHIKYYKGLGTSTAKEAKEWFEHMNDAQYIWTDHSHESIDLAFNKKRPDDRKAWLQDYDATKQVDYTTKKVPIERFIHNELIHFSNADNIRSLPSIMDGLKPSQRKVLFGCLKRNLRQEIKVAQLAGYVSEHAAYHHGEASLNGTIIGMAQNFVGSNNINLLRPNGQFGSRLQGGKDAASPRYIFTCLEKIVDTIFPKEDAAILNYLEDDGQAIEPDYYLPVIPLIAINGSVGIGTGFSTNIPSYDPQQIVSLLRRRLQGSIDTLAGRHLDPYFQGFNGPITRPNDVTWRTHGLYELDDDRNVVTITELPVGTWSQDYKEMLEKMFTAAPTGGAGNASQSCMADSIGLRHYIEENTDRTVRIELHFTADGFNEVKSSPEDFEKTFKLTEDHRITNMCCFDSEGKIIKYDSIGDILEVYFERRYEGYIARKAALIKQLEGDLTQLTAKARFIQAYLDKTLKIERCSDEEIISGLKAHDLPPLDMPEASDNIKAYEYLMSMRLDRLKASKVEELLNEVEKAQSRLDELRATHESVLWMNDLVKFEIEYVKMIEDRAAEASSSIAAASGSKKGRGGSHSSYAGGRGKRGAVKA
jgi:DNA topoisomerase-2